MIYYVWNYGFAFLVMLPIYTQIVSSFLFLTNRYNVLCLFSAMLFGVCPYIGFYRGNGSPRGNRVT